MSCEICYDSEEIDWNCKQCTHKMCKTCFDIVSIHNRCPVCRIIIDKSCVHFRGVGMFERRFEITGADAEHVRRILQQMVIDQEQLSRR